MSLASVHDLIPLKHWATHRIWHHSASVGWNIAALHIVRSAECRSNGRMDVLYRIKDFTEFFMDDKWMSFVLLWQEKNGLCVWNSLIWSGFGFGYDCIVHLQRPNRIRTGPDNSRATSARLIQLKESVSFGREYWELTSPIHNRSGQKRKH